MVRRPSDAIGSIVDRIRRVASAAPKPDEDPSVDRMRLHLAVITCEHVSACVRVREKDRQTDRQKMKDREQSQERYMVSDSL